MKKFENFLKTPFNSFLWLFKLTRVFFINIFIIFFYFCSLRFLCLVYFCSCFLCSLV